MTLILASQSPRRQQLMEQMGYNFDVRHRAIDESYPDHLSASEIVLFLCEKKARSFQSELSNTDILLTADTIVCLGDRILEKPHTQTEALAMLSTLSGRTHHVFTGVCVATNTDREAQFCSTSVSVRPLHQKEIDYYVSHYKPYDKAGGYGIQEWFGAVAVEKIEGSFNNVMGLPTHLVYQMLSKYSDKISFKE